MPFRISNFRIVPQPGAQLPNGSSAMIYSEVATSASMGASSAIPGSSTPAGSSAFIVIQSSAYDISYAAGYGIQYTFRGRQPQGVIRTMESMDGSEYFLASSAYLNLDASAATTSTIPATPTTGVGIFNSNERFAKFVKLQFIASTASSGSMVATMQLKNST